MNRIVYAHYLKILAKRFIHQPRFSTRDIKVGRGSYFGRNVRINCSRVRIGDGVIFQDNIRIDATDFEIGDYGTVYFGCFFPGPGTIRIGHNSWVGSNSVLDGQGGLYIGNNVCVGVQSQLWTHMKYGDVVAGCRFNSVAPLTVGDDVWLGASNLVGPVSIGERSLTLMGSLVVKDIPPDRVFAGVPAKDETEKLGPQFSITHTDFRISKLKNLVEKFALEYEIENIWNYVEICSELPDHWDGRRTVIAVSSRTYYKTRSWFELILMRHLLPEAKYIPAGTRQNIDRTLYDSKSSR